MSLRDKATLFIFFVMIVVVGTLYLTSSSFFQTRIETLERQQTLKQVSRVKRVFTNEMDEMGRIVRSLALAGDDEDHLFTAKRYQRLGLLETLDLDFIALRENKATAIIEIGQQTDLASQRLIAELTGTEPLGPISGTGFIRVNGTPILISSTAIQAKPGQRSLVTGLLAGRIIDEARLMELGTLQDLDIVLQSPEDLASQLEPDLADMVLRGEDVINILGNNRIVAHSLLSTTQQGKDIVLSISQARPFIANALELRSKLITLMVLIGAATMLIMIMLLRGTLLKRFGTLSASVNRIAQGASPSHRISLTGRDEFAQLAKDINVMLSTLESSENALRESEARYKLAALAVNDGLWDWDLDTDEVYYSPRWRALLGFEEKEYVGGPEVWLGRLHEDDEERVRMQLEQHLEGYLPQFESEYRLRKKDDTYVWVLSRGVADRDAEGRATRMAGSLTDITQRGLFDSLTGLPNRTLLIDRISHAIRKMTRHVDYSCAVLFMDVNRFKVINDSLGHQIGDLLLIELAKRLQLCVRSGDTVARLGGDEFVILLENVESRKKLMQILDRIERYTSTSFNLNGHHVVSSVSVGVLTDVSRYDSVEDVLRDADIAMYHAKDNKKPYVLYNPAMYAKAAERQQTEVEMRLGLERGEFFLVYQPIVSLKDGSINGFEALLRWQHPLRGMVSPDEFIPIAEETGLILPLGDWVLKEACHQMSKWPYDSAEGVSTVSVNLSSKQLLQSDLVERVRIALEDSRLAPERLKLEITESSIVEDPAFVAEVLNGFKELGVQVCLDDFGTGYSSLSYIHTLPLDVVKIDKSFIQKMQEDTKSFEIVRTVTSLAQRLGLDVVSEGIESVGQVSLLKDLNCRYGQGYLFSQPLMLETAHDFALSALEPTQKTGLALS